MRKSQVAEILARRLNVAPGRVQGIVERLTDAGLVTKAVGNTRYPPDIAPSETLAMVIAVLADRGLGNVRTSVAEFAALPADDGQSFGDWLGSVLAGSIDPGSLAIGSVIVRHQPAGISVTSSTGHRLFGAPPPDRAVAKATLVPGRALAALALETSGQSPATADAVIALSRAGAHIRF
ncbi:hypothetical protein ACP4J4_02660 [Aureimonas ureilytica]|uniref:hypothetical protein n=1 Tax=Aureimonas ureilytica TaxID=401562 RepID=UPI003CF95219